MTQALKLMRLSIYILSLCGLSVSASTLQAAVLSGDTFSEQITENVAEGDPIPTVRLFFSGEALPAAVEKRTETQDSYSLSFYYFNVPETVRALTVTHEVSGDLVGTTSLAASNDQFDWSSRVGISANPFTMEAGRYYRLTFVSNAPSRFSGRRTDYFYFALQQGAVVPPPTDNLAPTIQLLPAPGADLAFQTNISTGLGFTLYAEDPNGATDLDWNSLRVFIAGVDKTAHFRTVATALGSQRLSMQAAEHSLSIFVKPDPAQFTGAHNLFNLQWNGEWPVVVRLCDKGGLCGQSEYILYVGPFLTFNGAKDLRCASPSVHISEALEIAHYRLANIGFDAPLSLLFLGLQQEGSQDLWTFYLSKLGVGVLSRDLYPLLPPMPLAPGPVQEGGPMRLGLAGIVGVGTENWSTALLPNGTYKLMSAVLDKATGAMQIFEQRMPICNP